MVDCNEHEQPTGGQPPISGDEPVGRAGDRLGRRSFARLIAHQILASRPADGLVVSVAGPWGSGKTSVLRMVREEIEASSDAQSGRRAVVVEFNPWLFSGSEQLTAYFFVSLADQLPDVLGRSDATTASDRLRRYGAALGTLRSLPGVGGIFGTGADVMQEAAKRSDTAPVGLPAQRAAVAAALRDLDTHLVVLIDDVDRLQSATEIQDLMRMVKLVGDLPGVTYVLSYDRRPVVSALKSPGVSGEEYLEKIVQVEHRLPEVPRAALSGMLLAEIQEAIVALPDDRFDADRWSEVFPKIVEPLVSTPRHVRRYGNALRLSLHLHGEEVDVVDQLALAALTTFLPGLHTALPGLAEFLLPTANFWSAVLMDEPKETAARRLEEVVVESEAPDVARAAFLLLFPRSGLFLASGAAGSDDREAQRRRRVTDPEVFWTYFTAVLPEETLTLAAVHRVLDATHAPEILIQELSTWEDEQLPALVERLRAHVKDIALADVPHVARIIAHEGRRRVPSEPARVDDPFRQIEWFVADLVSRLPAEQRARYLLERATEEDEPVAKLDVYNAGKYKTDDGSPIAGEDALDAIRGQLAEAVAATPAATILGSPYAGRMLWLASEHYAQTDLARFHRLLSDDGLFARYLLVHTEPSFGDGPRPLAWAAVKEVLGEEWTVRRLRDVDHEAALSPELAEVLNTARSIVEGERGS